MRRLLYMAAMAALATPLACAQTAPDLFVFEAGTPIRASEVNHNFQLLQERLAEALGVTTDDVSELAAAVEKLQAALDNGDLDGASLEFTWDGTRLGIRQEGATAYDFVDLRGPVGPQGEQGEKGDPGAPGADGADGAPGADGDDGADGRGLEFAWDGTRLGVRYEGEPSYTYVDLVGPQGEKGEQGLRGETGLAGADGANGADGADGADGSDGADGRGLEFAWNGTQLGVRYQGDSEYTYVDLRGPKGDTGAAGATGATGATGLTGPAGADGVDGADGRTILNGAGSPSNASGVDGDFYIDRSVWAIYGPKAAGSWGPGTSLVGPQGPAGEDGEDGGGGASMTSRIVSIPETIPTGAFSQAYDIVASCESDELLVDVTLTGPADVWIYGWVIEIKPINAYESLVSMARDTSRSVPITVHLRCLSAA